MSATECRRAGMRHRFDYYSGWCWNGCGNRDDGRITNWTGAVISAGDEHTAEELTEYRERMARRK